MRTIGTIGRAPRIGLQYLVDNIRQLATLERMAPPDRRCLTSATETSRPAAPSGQVHAAPFYDRVFRLSFPFSALEPKRAGQRGSSARLQFSDSSLCRRPVQECRDKRAERQFGCTLVAPQSVLFSDRRLCGSGRRNTLSVRRRGSRPVEHRRHNKRAGPQSSASKFCGRRNRRGASKRRLGIHSWGTHPSMPSDIPNRHNHPHSCTSLGNHSRTSTDSRTKRTMVLRAQLQGQGRPRKLLTPNPTRVPSPIAPGSSVAQGRSSRPQCSSIRAPRPRGRLFPPKRRPIPEK